jgi:hypothetical protein
LRQDTLTHDGAGAEDHRHAAAEIGVEANFDCRRPSTARQQQMACSYSVCTSTGLFALILRENSCSGRAPLLDSADPFELLEIHGRAWHPDMSASLLAFISRFSNMPR